MIDLSDIYIKEKVRSGKIPARYPTKTSVVGSASRCRTWGTGNRKNLIKARLECQSTRSVPWAVKKASSQAEVGCKEHKATTVTSKSSFLLEEPERRISRGYCRDVGPRSSLSVYILGPWPKLRTRGYPKRINLCQKRLCQ